MARPIRQPIVKPDTIETIITKYFDAYKNSDRDALESLVSDDLTFTSPHDNAINREEYFERCWPMHEHIDNFMVTHIFAKGDEAFVSYLLTLDDGRQFSNTELMTMTDGKINTVHAFFGPTYKNSQFVMPA